VTIAVAGATAGGGAGQGGIVNGSNVGGVNMLGFANGESVDGVIRSSGFDSLFDPWRALTGAVGSAGTTISITTSGAFGAGQGGVAAASNVSNTGLVYFGGGVSTYSGSFSASSSSVIFGGGSGGAAGGTSLSSGNGGNAIASIERIK